MRSWKTKKTLYEIHEIKRGKHEVYNMMMTGEEITAWCKMKNDAYGYIDGVGGDRSYGCWAVQILY